MSETPILTESKTPEGRYAFVRADRRSGFVLHIESIENEGEFCFWLPVRSTEGAFLAYLKFVTRHFKEYPYFSLEEIRPAGCPNLGSESRCRLSSAPLLGEI